MTFTAFDTVLYTIAFLVPGFIINSIFARFCSEDEPEKELLFLRFLTYSAINYAMWSWLIYLIFRLDIFVLHPLLTAFTWTLIVFVSPVFLGLVFGYCEQRDFIHDFFRNHHDIVLNGIDNRTAWDLIMQAPPNRDPMYVLVTLVNGSQVRGILGERSLATRSKKGGDLYLEKVMITDTVDPKGPWIEEANSSGIWIQGREIRHIEFWG